MSCRSGHRTAPPEKQWPFGSTMGRAVRDGPRGGGGQCHLTAHHGGRHTHPGPPWPRGTAGPAPPGGPGAGTRGTRRRPAPAPPAGGRAGRWEVRCQTVQRERPHCTALDIERRNTRRASGPRWGLHYMLWPQRHSTGVSLMVEGKWKSHCPKSVILRNEAGGMACWVCKKKLGISGTGAGAMVSCWNTSYQPATCSAGHCRGWGRQRRRTPNARTQMQSASACALLLCHAADGHPASPGGGGV